MGFSHSFLQPFIVSRLTSLLGSNESIIIKSVMENDIFIYSLQVCLFPARASGLLMKECVHWMGRLVIQQTLVCSPSVSLKSLKSSDYLPHSSFNHFNCSSPVLQLHVVFHLVGRALYQQWHRNGMGRGEDTEEMEVEMACPQGVCRIVGTLYI